MTTIIVSAEPCRFETMDKVHRVRSHNLMQPKTIQRRYLVTTLEGIDTAMKEVAGEAGLMLAGSYFVHERLAPGERAPRGYRQRRFLIEVDRDTGQDAKAA